MNKNKLMIKIFPRFWFYPHKNKNFFIYLSIYLSIYHSIYLSIYLSI